MGILEMRNTVAAHLEHIKMGHRIHQPSLSPTTVHFPLTKIRHVFEDLRWLVNQWSADLMHVPL